MGRKILTIRYRKRRLFVFTGVASMASPGMMEVGGFLSDFEAVRTTSRPHECSTQVRGGGRRDGGRRFGLINAHRHGGLHALRHPDDHDVFPRGVEAERVCRRDPGHQKSLWVVRRLKKIDAVPDGVPEGLHVQRAGRGELERGGGRGLIFVTRALRNLTYLLK